MSTADKSKLKGYLLESTQMEIEEIEANDYSIRASDQLKARIKANINGKQKRHNKKIIVISVIATIVVLLAVIMAIPTTRNKIFDFFSDAFEKITSPDDTDTGKVTYPDKIEVEYEFGYFAQNGFERFEKETSSHSITTSWKKGNVYITTEQRVVEGDGNLKLETEDSPYEVRKIDGHLIYCVNKNNTYTLRWITDEYSYMISSYGNLDWKEMEKIILSKKPIEGK